MQVADLMFKRVAYVPETSTIAAAAEVLALTTLNDLIVIHGGKMVGTISDGDILRALMPDLQELYLTPISYDDLNHYFLQSLEINKNKPILPLIVRNPIVLAPTDSIIKAVTLMLNHKIIRLPVVLDDVCIGSIGRNDVNWALACHNMNKPL